MTQVSYITQIVSYGLLDSLALISLKRLLTPMTNLESRHSTCVPFSCHEIKNLSQ